MTNFLNNIMDTDIDIQRHPPPRGVDPTRLSARCRWLPFWLPGESDEQLRRHAAVNRNSSGSFNGRMRTPIRVGRGRYSWRPSTSGDTNGIQLNNLTSSRILRQANLRYITT